MSDEFEVTPEAQAWFDKEASGLKNKVDQVTGRNVEQRAKIEGMEKDRKAMLDRFEDDESKRLWESGSFEDAFNRKFQTSLQKSTETIMDLERQVEASVRSMNDMKISMLASEASLQSGVMPNAVGMMALQVAKSYQVNKDGNVIGRNPDGTEMFNEKGESMPMAEYVGSLHASMGYMFAQQQGSGANGSGAGQAGVKKSDMSREQKSAYVEQHGSEKFLALPA